ncbi:hypothetical protein I302_100740 [Kwoniella bestiolae CBS 10118]|uniref:C2H2-type domain-containing protein n=1 Tax=Kwoniella bestiolae CBS 10118 TaxID=1296100 RepID=A0AAJ8M4S5_9TREE
MENKIKPQPRVSTANLSAGLAPGTYSAAGGTPSWRSGPSPSPTPPIAGMTPTTPLPPPTNVVPRALTERESQLVKHLSRLQFFLATAPTRWMGGDDSSTSPFHSTSLASPHPNLNRFLLPNGEHVACVFWNGLYHITGTDIVRALVFRFEAFSRPVRNMKKFEEGVFSDLRNLKPGTDACLEEPKSPFLDLLFRNGCIRTQKKVFYWFSVPHDRLFLDALERDLKREKMGLEPTTIVVGEPARSFRYDPKRSLFEQFAGKQPGLEESINPNPRVIDSAIDTVTISQDHTLERSPPIGEGGRFSPDTKIQNVTKENHNTPSSAQSTHHFNQGADRDLLESQSNANTVLFSRSLLKGSPAYKQGRRKSSREKKPRQHRADTATTNYDTGDDESGSDSERLHRSEYSFPLAGDEASMSSSNFIPPPPIFPNTRASPVNFNSPRPAQSGQLGHPSPSSNLLPLSNTIPPTRAHPGSWSSNFVHVIPNDRTAPSSSYPHLAASQGAIASAIPGSLGVTNAPAKGFSCPLLSCGRLFKRLEHLKRHVRTHTQERPYECTRCAKRFSRSDNLTQHIKTHEKADRGERMKTEASESTEDDIAILLEAEVDAMAARENRGFSASMNSTVNAEHLYGLNYGEVSTSLQGHFSPARLPMLPPSFSGVNEYGENLQSHIQADRPQTVRPDWTSTMTNSVPTISGHVAESAFVNKRHRSMTPNLPLSGRTSITEPHVPHYSPSSYLSTSRFHPYAPSTVNQGLPPFTRAASLDPSALLSRTPIYDDGLPIDQSSQHPLHNTSKESNRFASFSTAENVNHANHPQSYGLADLISETNEMVPSTQTRFDGVHSNEQSKEKEQNDWTEY